MTDMIEKMASGCLPVGQGDPKQQSSPHSEHVDEVELFRRFAKLPCQSLKHPQPSNRHLVNKTEDHQQMKWSSGNTPDKTLIESDSSIDMEESSQSVTGPRESFDSHLSGCSEEEIEKTNVDKTLITRREQKKAQKEKVQYLSSSDSSFNKSDEFFTPNPEPVSLYSETSSNGGLTENQLTKESTSSEEELEITREVCRKNTVSLRSSSGSDIDIVGKEVIGKVMERRNSTRDWSGVSTLSFTPSAGSFTDIQDLSCIPCDRHFMNKLLLSKTPLCTGGPINNSTPYSVITGRNVSSSCCPHYAGFESLLLQSKIIDTSLWHSPESSVISPGTFATACDETSKIQNPITLPAATSVISIAESPLEAACGQLYAAFQIPPIQVTEEKAKQMPEDIIAEGIVQKLEDQEVERITPERLQEMNQDTLDPPRDCERCRLQKAMEETERAHSTLDSVLEMMESRDQQTEEIIKNHAPNAEDLCVLQKEEYSSTGNQTNTTTAQGDSGSKTSGTSASTAVASSTSEESSNKKPTQRANWTQPHRVIILE